MNQLTYHHYATTILDTPIAQLHGNLGAILGLPRTTGQTIAVAEKITDCAAGIHTLIYRSTIAAPVIAEYVATWTLASIADAPHTTSVEWACEYRPAAHANHDQIQPFVSALIDHDREIASRFAAECGGAEILYIDYTLGAV